MRKKLALTLMSLVCALICAFGLAACGGGSTQGGGSAATKGLEYTLSDDGTYYILTGVGSASSKGAIVIASEYNGKPVTEIGNRALNKQYYNSVVIPESITTIGSQAFSQLSTMKYTGDLAKWCAISFASNVVSTDMNNKTAIYINGKALSDTLVVPDSVTSIGQYTFAGFTMKNVTIPAAVTDIGERAFYGCRTLEGVTIANGVQSVGKEAFSGSAIKSVTLPDSVTAVGQEAFRTMALETVKTGNGLTSIESYAFSGVKSIEIGTGVQSIKKTAFGAEPSLTSIKFGNVNGWYISQSSSGANSSHVPPATLDDASAAATYFNQHSDYNWFYNAN